MITDLFTSLSQLVRRLQLARFSVSRRYLVGVLSSPTPCHASGTGMAREWRESGCKSSVRIYQGYSKGIRFAATILVLLWIGVGNVWGDTKTDIMYAKGFGSYTTNSYSAAGSDKSAVANSTNATSVTYAMQVFNGSTGAVRGNQSGAANFSCRNTSTYTGYYISQVQLTVSDGTIDGSTSGRSVVYFGTSAYANPNTTAPSGTATSASPSSSGQTTLTWTNTNTDVSYFILYNLKTANTALSANSTTSLKVTWTQKASGNAITLDKNGGSADGAGTIANSATTMTVTTAPTRVGYSVEGYYKEAGCTNKVATASGALQPSIDGWTNGSSQFTKNVAGTLYAGWTPKVCAITLNKGTSGTADGSMSYTYGNSSNTGEITHATKTGYHLNGYYTASSGGTKILNADGTLAGNDITVSTTTYTSGGNWAYDGISLTLYAQWTIDTYTVAWEANGTDWTGAGHGSPSTSANYNTKVTTIPTAPTSSQCDGNKVFVGWTKTPIDGTTNTVPSDLFTIQSNSPAITSNTTFYAVFATTGTATFNAADITATPATGNTLEWEHTASGTLLKISAGQRYTGSPNAWNVTAGTSNYMQITAGSGKALTQIVATITGANYKLNTVSTGTLSISSTTQTVRDIRSNTIKCYATSSYQVRITTFTVTYGSAFATSCCEQLGSINGSFSRTGG